jgi:hypothetical protein
MEAIKTLNLLIRFLLELCILLIFGYWGFKTGNQGVSKALLGIGVPLASAIIWGAFLAPKAAWRLSQPWLTLLEVTIFGLTTWALHSTGKTSLAVTFGSIYLINKILMLIWRQ